MNRKRLVQFLALALARTIHAETTAVRDTLRSSSASKVIEYFWAKPEGTGPFPLLLMVHPHQDSPKPGGKAFVNNGQLDYWAKKGFRTVAISQPGYGGSDGPADFCGPRTQAATLELLRFYRAQSKLISKRQFLYGGSRGAVVASMVAAQDIGLSGVVLKSGVYDFVEWATQLRWYDSLKLTMLWEMGWLSDSKLYSRSAFFVADKIKSPVLMIHGTKDDRAPLTIAENFNDSINRAGGQSSIIKIDSEHVIPMGKINELMNSFFQAHSGDRQPL